MPGRKAFDGVGSSSLRLPDVHAFDEAIRDGIHVPHLAIKEEIAAKAFHKLVNSDVVTAALLFDYLKWFYIGSNPSTGRVQ